MEDILTEDDLLRLPYKELKRLAIQRNIHLKCKKADLVNALVSTTSETLYMTPCKELISEKRLTRSTANLFMNSNDMMESVNSVSKTFMHSDNNISNTLGEIPSINETKYPNQNRKKQITDNTAKTSKSHITSDIFPSVNSIHTEIEPLQETTNKELLTNGNLQIPNNGSKKHSKRKNFQKDTKHVLSCDSLNASDKPLLELSFLGYSMDKNENEELNSINIVSNKEQVSKKTKRNNKKKKIMDESGSVVKKNKHVANIEEQVELAEKHIAHDKSQIKNKTRRNTRSSRNLMYDDQKEIDNSEGNTSDSVIIGVSKTKKVKMNQMKKENIEEVVENSVSNTKTQGLTETSMVFQQGTSSRSQSVESTLNNNEVTVSYSSVRNNRKRERSITKNHINNAPIILQSKSEHHESLPDTNKENKSVVLNKDADQEKPKLPAEFEHPKRSNTFILDEKQLDADQEKPKLPADFEQPKRSNTFILDEKQLALKSASTPNQNEIKCDKSIGKRILMSSIKKGSMTTFTKQTSGSTLKKSMKNKVSLGSSLKKSIKNTVPSGKKMLNFQLIHKKLFNNMESLGENYQRKVERAQALLQSPLVPRCALPVNRPKKDQLKEETDFNLNKATPSRVASPVIRSNVQPVVVPLCVQSPVAHLTSTNKARTPSVAEKLSTATRYQNCGSASVHRFGFRNCIRKKEATSIVGSKLPVVDMKKKKDEDRKFLQGVRMNRRFMLQMQLRQNSPK